MYKVFLGNKESGEFKYNMAFIFDDVVMAAQFAALAVRSAVQPTQFIIEGNKQSPVVTGKETIIG